MFLKLCSSGSEDSDFCSIQKLSPAMYPEGTMSMCFPIAYCLFSCLGDPEGEESGTYSSYFFPNILFSIKLYRYY